MGLYEEQVALEVKAEKEAVSRKALELQKALAEGRFSDVPQGKLLLKLGFEQLVSKIDEFKLTKHKGTTNKDKNLLLLLEDDSATLAFITLTKTINLLNQGSIPLIPLATAISSNLKDLSHMNQLKENNPKLHSYLGSEFRRASKSRKAFLISKHTKEIQELPDNNIGRATLIRIGSILINLMLLSGSGVFQQATSARFSNGRTRLKGYQYVIEITPEGMEALDSIDWRANAMLNANMLPMIHPPREWTGVRDGGYLTHQQSLCTTKSLDVKKWQKKQDFSKLLPVVNKLQQTGWRVNSFMLDLVQDVIDMNIIDPKTAMLKTPLLIGGLTPDISYRWQEVIKEEDYPSWSLFNRAREKLQVDLDALLSKKLQTLSILTQAHTMRDYERFYYTYQFDYRGRIYPTAILSHQGPSFGKALLEFSEGRLLDNNGVFWLKIHTANVFGNDKDTFEERIQWFEDNRASILTVAKSPLECKSLWIHTDSPYEYVAACRAYSDYIEGKEVRLPIQLDAICSGISIYSGLLLDTVGAQETAIINKYDAEGTPIRPDIYKTVAELVNKYLREGDYPATFEYTDSEGKTHMATTLIEGNSIKGKITRSMVKRNVMTVPYSVTMRGMSNQLWDVLEEAIALGQEFWEGEAWVVNKLLTTLNHRAIYEVVKGARVGQDYLVSLSRIPNGPAEWVTPLYNFPIKQTALKTSYTRVQTPLGTLNLIVEVPKLDKRKQSSSIAPNFIHSLDSEILKYCIHHMSNGIGVIHDCVLVHPNDGYEAQDKYREGYVKLMELNPLEHISKQLDPDGTIKVPDRGELKLKDVYKSKYIIS